MSISFGLYPVVQYSGIVTSGPISLCTPASRAPSASTIELDWDSPGVNRSAVSVDIGNIAGTANARPLEKIASVLIDNSNCAFAVYVVAADIGHVIGCPAGDMVYAPVMTGGTTVIIYPTDASVVTDLFSTGKSFGSGITRIIFSNVYVSDFTPVPTKTKQTLVFQWWQSASNMAPGTVQLPLGSDLGAMRVDNIVMQPTVFNATVANQEIQIRAGRLEAGLGVIEPFWSYYYRSATITNADTRQLQAVVYPIGGFVVPRKKTGVLFYVEAVSTLNAARFILSFYGSRLAAEYEP